MPKDILQTLYGHYPKVIAQMPHEFTSHQFILCLAEQNQRDYIEALNSYRGDDPFRKVHARLANQLHQHCESVRQLENVCDDPDIFGHPQLCSQWQKLA